MLRHEPYYGVQLTPAGELAASDHPPPPRAGALPHRGAGLRVGPGPRRGGAPGARGERRADRAPGAPAGRAGARPARQRDPHRGGQAGRAGLPHARGAGAGAAGAGGGGAGAGGRAAPLPRLTGPLPRRAGGGDGARALRRPALPRVNGRARVLAHALAGRIQVDADGAGARDGAWQSSCAAAAPMRTPRREESDERLKWLLAGAALGVILVAFRDFDNEPLAAAGAPRRRARHPGRSDEEEPILGYDGMDEDTLMDWLADADLDATPSSGCASYERAHQRVSRCSAPSTTCCRPPAGRPLRRGGTDRRFSPAPPARSGSAPFPRSAPSPSASPSSSRPRGPWRRRRSPRERSLRTSSSPSCGGRYAWRISASRLLLLRELLPLRRRASAPRPRAGA